MYNRGMIDDVIVVGTGLLPALLLCGGLVVYEERKDRTGAVSPIEVEFLSASPCLYDTTPIGGTLLSVSGENSGLKTGDAISYQLEQEGSVWHNGKYGNYKYYSNSTLFPCYVDVVPTQDAKGNWHAGFNLLSPSGDTVNAGFEASSNRRKTEYRLISGGNTSLDTGIYGFTLKFSGLTVGDRYVFAGQELSVSDDGSAIASVLTPCGGVGFNRDGSLSRHGYHYLSLVRLLDSGTVEKEIEFSIEMAH